MCDSNQFVNVDHHEQVDNRRDRLEARSSNATAKSNELHANARGMASGIPFGQPILVGHHSEKRDRGFRNKIEGKFRRSFEEAGKAEHYQQRADAVGSAGISSVAPDALTELRTKLEALEQQQATMKKANAEFKKGGFDAITCLNESELQVVKDTMARVSYHRRPFESYSLTNNGAVIRNTRKRIEEIEQLRRSVWDEIETEDYRIFAEDGRMQIEFFNGKPSEKTRTLLKSYAFKWSRYSMTWVRKSTANAVYSTRTLANELAEIVDIY